MPYTRWQRQCPLHVAGPGICNLQLLSFFQTQLVLSAMIARHVRSNYLMTNDEMRASELPHERVLPGLHRNQSMSLCTSRKFKKYVLFKKCNLPGCRRLRLCKARLNLQQERFIPQLRAWWPLATKACRLPLGLQVSSTSLPLYKQVLSTPLDKAAR